MKYTFKFETENCVSKFANISNISEDKLYLTSELTYQNNIFTISKIRRKPYPQHFENYTLENQPYYTKEKGRVLELKISIDDVQSFKDVTGITFTDKAKSFWMSPHTARYRKCYYTSDSNQKNKYPIYIPSKGRANYCYTANSLLDLGIDDFYIIVEKQEYNDYLQVYDRKNLLVLPQEYLDNYVTYDELGSTKSKGPGAARNFAWEHSIENGHSYHWVS